MTIHPVVIKIDLCAGRANADVNCLHCLRVPALTIEGIAFLAESRVSPKLGQDASGRRDSGNGKQVPGAGSLFGIE